MSFWPHRPTRIIRAAPSRRATAGWARETGVGASMALNRIDNSVVAHFQDGANLSGKANHLVVAATGLHVAETVAENGAEGDETGIGAAVTIALLDNTTLARIGTGGQVALDGTADIQAIHVHVASSQVGSEASGGDTRVGVAVAVQEIDDQSDAVVARSVSADGEIAIESGHGGQQHDHRYGELPRETDSETDGGTPRAE